MTHSTDHNPTQLAHCHWQLTRMYRIHWDYQNYCKLCNFSLQYLVFDPNSM